MVKVMIMITMNRHVCNEMNVKGIYWQQAGNLKHEADSTGSGLLLLHVICGAAQFASCAAQSTNHTYAPCKFLTLTLNLTVTVVINVVKLCSTITKLANCASPQNACNITIP